MAEFERSKKEKGRAAEILDIETLMELEQLDGQKIRSQEEVSKERRMVKEIERRPGNLIC